MFYRHRYTKRIVNIGKRNGITRDKSVFIIFDWREVPTDKVALNNATRGFYLHFTCECHDALALSPARYKIGNNGAGLRLFLCAQHGVHSTMYTMEIPLQKRKINLHGGIYCFKNVIEFFYNICYILYYLEYFFKFRFAIFIIS